MSQPRPDRPWMPGYQNADAQPDAGSWTRAEESLAKAKGYWVATTRPDGRPHVMPVWGVMVQSMVWFSTSRTSRKGRNLAANPNVSVHIDDTDDVVVIEGIVEEVEAGDAEFPDYAGAYEAKYKIRPGPSSERHVVYRVRPRVAFAWRESDFADRATRWTFD